ncbi:MAG: hypothetical protein M3N48_08810 [Verrucomicrobiota bacterium]|nr:hypothetical protein [Verrucomicrobiota bacterium]
MSAPEHVVADAKAPRHECTITLASSGAGLHGKISAEFPAELPVSIDNTALQAVPDYRLRRSFAIRF